MKRRDFFGTAAALAVAAAVAGPVQAQDKTYTIGVSIPSATHGFMGGLNWHAQQSIARLEATYPNVKFVLATAGEPGKQVDDIEDMLATRNIDGLVVLPFESEPLTGPVKAVKDAGKWVTVVDRGLSVEGIEDLFVAGDNTAFGRVAGEYFKANLPSGAKVVVLRGIPTTLDNERVEAFEKAIEGSGIEVLDKQHGNWNRDDAFTVMQDYLTKFPKIDVVWCQDDDMAVGVLQAIEQAGRTDIQYIIGGAGSKDMIKKVMDGDKMIPVDVLYPPAMVGTALEMTVANFYGQVPVRGVYTIDATLVTKDNAKDFYFPDSPF